MSLLALLSCVLCSSSIHMWWFNTDLPVYVFKLLRTLGLRRHASDFWPDDDDYKFWYRTRWTAWLSATDLPLFVRNGLICPGCFSLHTSFWASVLLAPVYCHEITEYAALIVVGTVTVPSTTMLLSAALRALNAYGNTKK